MKNKIHQECYPHPVCECAMNKMLLTRVNVHPFPPLVHPGVIHMMRMRRTTYTPSYTSVATQFWMVA